MTILNLTQHAATASQLEAGVVEPRPEVKAAIQKLLTVEDLPTEEDLRERASAIASTAASSGYREAMIGGAGPVMRALRLALKGWGIQPREAFSRRETVESHAPDGRVTKTAVFVHAGWWPDVD